MAKLNTYTRNSWRAMRQRCNNVNHKYYASYGGAGIVCCTRWVKFSNFLEDMGERPLGTTLDRINNAAGYWPNNCRWATRVQQRRNNSHMRMLTHKGETLCMRDWAMRFGIDERTIYARLSVYGWSVERALTEIP